jgi:hypothetical protein
MPSSRSWGFASNSLPTDGTITQQNTLLCMTRGIEQVSDSELNHLLVTLQSDKPVGGNKPRSASH